MSLTTSRSQPCACQSSFRKPWKRCATWQPEFGASSSNPGPGSPADIVNSCPSVRRTKMGHKEDSVLMDYAILFVIGLLLGGLVMWSVTSSGMRSAYEAQAREAANRLAVAEANLESLHQQQVKDQNEIEFLRERLESEQRERATAQAFLEVERKNLEQNRKIVDEARQKLSDTFKALASEALGSQSDSFLNLARQAFGTLRAEAQGALASR